MKFEEDFKTGEMSFVYDSAYDGRSIGDPGCSYLYHATKSESLTSNSNT